MAYKHTGKSYAAPSSDKSYAPLDPEIARQYRRCEDSYMGYALLGFCGLCLIGLSAGLIVLSRVPYLELFEYGTFTAGCSILAFAARRISQTWRCPACRAYFGRYQSYHRCPHCGVRLYY